MEIEEYYSREEWMRFKAKADQVETPSLIVSLGIIRRRFEELLTFFPYAKIYYAVKANPAKEIIELLRDLGSYFDIASIFELDKVLSLGVSPDRISFGNTIKKEKHIKYAYDKGVRLFVTDSKPDLHKVARSAPGADVFVRLIVDGSETADWPLSFKFGCHPDMAYDIIVEAKKLGLNPIGLSFHVGSQQRDIGQWDDALTKAKYLFDLLEGEEKIKLKMINLGGGFPAHYIQKTNETKEYASEISRYLHDNFGDDVPQIMLEPGRSLVGDSGILTTEVVLVARKSNSNLTRWVYIDAGKFGGLIETIDESIKYPIHVERDGKREQVVRAGPTCDSMDILYENNKYELPVNLEMGDRLYFLTTGAYTASYSSVEFNGFPPLKVHFIE